VAKNRTGRLYVTVDQALQDIPCDPVAAWLVPREIRRLIEAGWRVLVVTPDGTEVGRYEIRDGEAHIAWNTH